jgi:hypothetical protein
MPPLEGCSLVACGTLRREVQALSDEKRIAPDNVVFTPPGLHEWPARLEERLLPRLAKAREASAEVVVAYGEKCFIDVGNPMRDMDALLKEQGPEFKRTRAKNCVDMIAGAEERDAVAAGEKVYWLTPGWVENWNFIFRFWDRGKANEMFPAYDKAIVLDGVGYFDELMESDPEKILEISDWMGISLEAHPANLERLLKVLSDAAA